MRDRRKAEGGREKPAAPEADWTAAADPADGNGRAPVAPVASHRTRSRPPPVTPAALLCAALLGQTGGPGGPGLRPDLPPPAPSLSFGGGAFGGDERAGAPLIRSPAPAAGYAPTEAAALFAEDGDDGPDFPTATVTGLLQTDGAWFGQDARSREAVGDVEDATAIRRIRLGAYGRAWENVDYYLEVDFARQGGTAIADAFFTLTDAVPNHDVRFGFFRQPVGMASRAGARILPLLERPLPFALQPFRQVGVGINGTDEDLGLSWEGTVYRFPSDSDGGVLGDRGGYSAAARLSALLWGDAESDSLLHTGVSAAFQTPADDAIRFFSRPETFSPESRGVVSSTGGNRAVPPFVNTTPLAADRSHILGLELLGRRGPAWFWSELNAVDLDPAEEDRVNLADANAPGLDAPRSAATFWGAHLTAGYFLTGERLPYDLKTATIGRVAPKHDFAPSRGTWGAVEALVRISHLDLTDNDDDFRGVRGGELTDLTLGANWYLNPRTKFQFNYIRAHLEDRATGPADGGESDTNIFAVRAQVDF